MHISEMLPPPPASLSLKQRYPPSLSYKDTFAAKYDIIIISTKKNHNYIILNEQCTVQIQSERKVFKIRAF